MQSFSIRRFLFAFQILIYSIYFAKSDRRVPVVSSPEDTNTNAIEGFGTDLQCFVDTCLSLNQQVEWYKNDVKITEGTDALQSRYTIRHSIQLSERGCYGTCSDDDKSCPGTQYCRSADSKCCTCENEEFTLVLTNVTMNDSATYSCRLRGSNHVNIRLLVVESGTFPAFGQNLTFNHTACCQSRGMSEECMPLCKPNSIQTQKFDPIPCQKEFSKLLQCATDNGNISHVHCCKLHFVPAFCWDYCSGSTTDFGRANRLCVYWMPEIFQCYEQAYLPFPGPPEGLTVNAINDTAIKVCWNIPDVRASTVEYYTVRYQEVPQFSFFGAASRGNSDESTSGSPLMVRRHKSVERRKKRQTLFLTTHNFGTNETEVREYRYLEYNTTDTCAEIGNLKPSTHYFVYATSTNNFGTSLPSLRENVVTASMTYANDSLPDVYGCCIRNGVDEKCAAKMCDLRNPPSSVSSFDLAYTCKKDFMHVSPCLADGRDHTECCIEKGVIGECLKFCDGSAQTIGMSSILCLSLDIQSIFSCYRRGYISLPSPPGNITVTDIESTSAKVMWMVPAINYDKVTNYSLFYGTQLSGHFTEVKDASNPYTLYELLPDKQYIVYVIARSNAGSSLSSSRITFTTAEPSFDSFCAYGKPLLDANSQPLRCGGRVGCPQSHKCMDSQTDDQSAKFCCPLDPGPLAPSVRVEPPNVTQCCTNKGVTQECLHLCSYKTTADDLTRSGISCAVHLQVYVDCGIDGRNNGPCCESDGVSDGVCRHFCTPPKTLGIMLQYLPCVKDVNKIIKCALEGVLYRPGPPLNVSVEDQGATWMTLHWKRPSQKVPVQKYEIRINNASTANATGLSYTLNGLVPNRPYIVDIVSWNERGSSIPSEPAMVELRSGKSDDDDKPRPPNTIRLQSFSDGTANISWNWRSLSVQNKPIDKVEFKFMYAPNDVNPKWQNVTTSDMYVEIKSLNRNQDYAVRIIAIDQDTKKESLPSEVNVITTIEDDQNAFIELWTDPHGYIQEGDYVVVHCLAKGSVRAKPLTLKHGLNILTKGIGSINYTFQKITVNDSNDPLFCLVDNDGSMLQKKEFLKIRHPPNASAPDSTKAVTKGDPVQLHCLIKGFPEPKTEWLFSKTGSLNFMNHVQNDQRRTSSQTYADEYSTLDILLTMEHTNPSDAGLYMCRSCNELGCANATVKLIIESFKLSSGPDELQNCCKRRKVKPECMSKCTGSFDWYTDHPGDPCASEMFDLLSCSRDGVDNRHCCSLRQVPESCVTYCNGILWDGEKRGNVNLCSRAVHKHSIASCVAEGQKTLPLTPEIEDVEELGNGKLNVSWKVPNTYPGNKIESYVLYYKSPNDENFTQVRAYSTYKVLDKLEPNTPYEVYVVSVNSIGPSPYGAVRTVEYSESTSRSGSAGLIFGLILLLLLIASAALSFVYFSRRPYKMPELLVKMTGRRKSTTHDGAVAFENPGYDSEGHVHVLSPNGASNGNTTSGDTGWQSAKLESPREMGDQKGMNYAQLS